MTKKIMNLLFLFLLLVFFISLIVINYQVDPHRVFHKDTYMDLGYIEPENIFIKLKAYRNIPYDTVLIGSSEAGTMFENSALTKKYFNRIYSGEGFLSQKSYYRVIKAYVDLHPETKRVIIIVNYPSLLNNYMVDYPVYTGPKYNLDELMYLFVGKETTELSLKMLYDSVIKKLEKISVFAHFSKEEGNIGKIFKLVNPYIADDFIGEKKEAIRNLEDNINCYNQLFDFLDSKNIKYTLVIPPYNVSFLALINNDKVYKKSFDSFLRYLTTKSSDIYDFALVNKYTLQDIFSNDNYLYINYNHPNFIFGLKVLKVLYNKTGAEKEIYIKLSSKNIDRIFKEQDKLLNEYVKSNSKVYSELKKIAYGEAEASETNQIISYENIPPEGKKELEYLDKETFEMEN